MRFLLFDRILDLDTGRSIRGLTSFGRSFAVSSVPSATIPTSMLIEAMVQILGWLIIHDHEFRLAAIVCLIENATVHGPPLAAGVTAEVGGEVVSSAADDSLGRAWLDVGGRRHATIERVIYRHFHDVDPEALEGEFRIRAGRGTDRVWTRGTPARVRQGQRED